MPPSFWVTVKPNSSKEQVEETAPGELRVSVHAPPHEGKANDALVRALAEHFGVPKSSISIRQGRTGRRKRVQIGG